MILAGELGKHVNDHVLLPAAMYIVDPKTVKVTGSDQYLPVFATRSTQPPKALDTGIWARDVSEGQPVTCLDFYSGELKDLVYYASHLYTALLLPNCIKSLMISNAWIFYTFSTSVRAVLDAVNFAYDISGRISNLIQGEGFVPGPQLQLVTATVKFVPAQTGQYEFPSATEQITLPLFQRRAGVSEGDSEQSLDEWLAEHELTKLIEGGLMEKLGRKPPKIVQSFIRFFTGLPYRAEDVPGYVRRFRENSLLTQQHLAGGCLFQKALNENGKVHGVENCYVADLSTSPLPRISTQMTAYLIGFHVGEMFCNDA
jgi:hypothetical protein